MQNGIVRHIRHTYATYKVLGMKIKKSIYLFVCLAWLLPQSMQAALYIVGSATEYMWNRQPMKEVQSGVYEWEGYLTFGGELKFMTSADGWGAHWGPSTTLSSLPYGSSLIGLHSTGDYKYRIESAGWVNITVDTKQRRVTLTREDGSVPYVPTYPQWLYPIGTAVKGEGDYTLTQQGHDTGIYEGQLQLTQGNLTLHARPYRTTKGANRVEAKMSYDATQTKKKLYIPLNTDRCAYQPGETVTFTASGVMPKDAHVRYRHLGDVVADTLISKNNWTWTVPETDYQGYMAEVYTTEGETDVILGTIAIDVSSDWNRFPRYGFVATFGNDKNISTIQSEMNWLNRCHINAVQFQDWHNRHDWPLGGTRNSLLSSYKDIANRTIYTNTVKNYLSRQHKLGMKGFFYNLCFGVLDGYEEYGVKAEWLAYTDKSHTTPDKHGLPSTWKSDIYLANPGNPEWQAYMADRNDDVYASLDFDGFQIDQLGPRRTLYDYKGNTIDLTSGYASFVEAMKRRHPDKHLIMNAVSGYGTPQLGATGKLDCFYNEVWGCHKEDALTASDAQFAHLKTLIDNNRQTNGAMQTVLAAYMNYGCESGYFNIPGVVMADAVIFALGGSHLELGGDHNLCREYFPYNAVKMGSDLQDWLTHYYDFSTAYENLLRGNWSENSTVRVSSTAATINKWAPVNGQITQLARDVEGRRVIHLLNFNCQPSDKVNAAYLMGWHDKDGMRPWPVEYKDVPLTVTGLTNLGKVRRVWVASPDYMGGAVQEIKDYELTSSTLRMTLPALQFWTMIVIEPEASSMPDHVVYGPSEADMPISMAEELPLQTEENEDVAYYFPFEGIYQATANLKAGTLTLRGEDSDNIINISLTHPTTKSPWGYTLQGLPATSHSRGIIIKNGRKNLK